MALASDDQPEQPPIGIIPAAGLATRLAPLVYPKELLPIVYLDEDGRLVPKMVIELSLDQLRTAGVERCSVIVSSDKLELVRILGDGARYGLSLNYLVQAKPAGLSHALAIAGSWSRDRDICLALPDTVIYPRDAFAQIRQERARTGADVVLAVFPTNRPETLGPVVAAADGRVLEVQDKPRSPQLRNTWGGAIWSKAFTELLLAEVAKDEAVVLGKIFQRAVERGFDVRAVEFSTGRFLDVGTAEGLHELLSRRSMV